MARKPTAVRTQMVGETDVGKLILRAELGATGPEGLFRPRRGTSSTGNTVETFRDDDTAAKEYSPSSGRSLADA
jgi:hypothetical protein